MVFRNLPNVGGMVQISPTISYVGNIEHSIAVESRDSRRTHTLERGIFFALFKDFSTGVAVGLLQCILNSNTSVPMKSPASLFLNGLPCQQAGHRASEVPAHSSRYDIKPQFVVDEEAILIILAL